MLKRLSITVFSLALLSISTYSAENPNMATVGQTVISRLTTQLKGFPQEKIYLHLDKPYYAVGEKIWFRAHMVHAALSLPYELSRYIYVELIDSKDVVVLREKVRPIDGMYYGQMPLSTDFTEGWYSIRAYTNYMRNVDEGFFYRRTLYIGNNLREQEKAKKDIYTKQSTGLTSSPFQIHFYPEGNHLIPGNVQAIGIRSTKADGSPVNVTGKLLDAKNNEIGTFNTHMGVGLVHIMPEEGQLYAATCKDEQGNLQTVKLPLVSIKDFALSVKQNKSAIQVSLQTPGGNPLTDTLLLVIHQRGIPLFQDYFASDRNELTLSSKNFQEGLLQFMLIDRQYNVLSERQIFIQEQNRAQVTVTTDKATYRRRERVNATIQLTDAAGKPIKGNFSVSVTDDADVVYDQDGETIESRLMLQSETQHALFNPGYYLKIDNKQAASELDMLMLTHPWTRYDLSSVMKGTIKKGDAYLLERGSSISGQVMSYPSKKGLPGNHVSLFIPKPSHVDAKSTDKNGLFYFDGFEFPDSTKIMLEAKVSLSSFIRLIVDKDSFPDVRLTLPIINEPTLKSTMKSFMNKSRERYFQETGVRIINLKEVEVVAQKQEKEKLERFRLDRGVAYFSPNHTIKQDRLETANSIMDLLITVPGVSLNPDGTGVLMRNKTPLIMVDNIKRDMNELTMITPTEVELIDILKEASDLAAYGTSGANGVIFIHLKRGEAATHSKEPESNQAIIQPLGYCVPETFPQPNYLNSDIRLNGIPDLRSTLFWKPNVVCDANGKATVNYFMGDNQGSCTLTIEGVTPDGKIIRYQGKINSRK